MIFRFERRQTVIRSVTANLHCETYWDIVVCIHVGPRSWDEYMAASKEGAGSVTGIWRMQGELGSKAGMAAVYMVHGRVPSWSSDRTYWIG